MNSIILTTNKIEINIAYNIYQANVTVSPISVNYTSDVVCIYKTGYHELS